MKIEIYAERPSRTRLNLSKNIDYHDVEVSLTEDRFISGIDDALNAEIALGTVTNVDEGVRWLGYTYLYVRMRKNPFQYGQFLEAPFYHCN
jgi:replicative superfamily II helicase